MKFNESNIVPSDTKIRVENGKQIKYVITDDSYEDDYGSWKSQYHAWRIEDGKPKQLTVDYYLNSQSDARAKITFGYNVTCKCCNHTKFVREEDYASLPKFYSQEEVYKMTSEAYNQGYEDGKGDSPRPVDRKKYESNWENIFRKNIISDGFGNEWSLCDRKDCGLHVVRPGKVQCDVCH